MDHTENIGQILRLDENKTCADCGRKNPDWASVSFGVCVCLQCSGIHRSMGTHITFVQSLKLDKWSDENIAKMKVGGNARANRFLRSRGINTSSITEKYNNQHAKQYSKIIADEASGVDTKKIEPKMQKSASSILSPEKCIPERSSANSKSIVASRPPPLQSVSTPNFVSRPPPKTKSALASRGKVIVVKMSAEDFDDALEELENEQKNKETDQKKENSSADIIRKMGL